jgi:hypothetical protein
MKRLYLFFVLLSLSTVGFVVADENSLMIRNNFSFSNSDLFQRNFDSGIGFTINYQNSSFEVLFSTESPMTRIISLSEDSNNSYRLHPVANILGNILMFAGAVAFLAWPFTFTVFNNNIGDFSFNNPAITRSVILFGGGVISLLAGGILTGKFPFK